MDYIIVHGVTKSPVFWPGEIHGLSSPWGPKESDTTERLHLEMRSHCSSSSTSGQTLALAAEQSELSKALPCPTGTYGPAALCAVLSHSVMSDSLQPHERS